MMCYLWREMNDAETPDQVAWVRRTNCRWIVRHGLGESAELYLDHLAKTDPQRLERSCRIAHQLARQVKQEDPKPWFYAGLFSLANVGEAKEFLTNRWFTISAIPALTAELGSTIPPGTMGAAAREKIQRIRKALSDLLVSI